MEQRWQQKRTAVNPTKHCTQSSEVFVSYFYKWHFEFRQELLSVRAACNVSVQCYQNLVFSNAWETRTNQSWLWITTSLWLHSSIPRLPMVFWRGWKLCSRGLLTIVWSDSVGELQCNVPFRYFVKVKLLSRDGHNLHKELNSALRIKCCSVVTWDLQK